MIWQSAFTALEQVQKGIGAEAYNLGTGKGHSVLEVIKAFEKVSGIRIPYKFVHRRPGDISTCYADPAKAQNHLNWVAMRGIEKNVCRYMAMAEK